MRQRPVRGGEDADFDLVDLGVGQRAPDHFAARQFVMKPILEKNEMPLPPISRRLTMGVALQNLVNSGTTRLWMGDRRLICTKAWLRQSSKEISVFFARGWLGAMTTPGGKAARHTIYSPAGNLPR